MDVFHFIKTSHTHLAHAHCQWHKCNWFYWTFSINRHPLSAISLFNQGFTVPKLIIFFLKKENFINLVLFSALALFVARTASLTGEASIRLPAQIETVPHPHPQHDIISLNQGSQIFTIAFLKSSGFTKYWSQISPTSAAFAQVRSCCQSSAASKLGWTSGNLVPALFVSLSLQQKCLLPQYCGNYTLGKKQWFNSCQWYTNNKYGNSLGFST